MSISKYKGGVSAARTSADLSVWQVPAVVIWAAIGFVLLVFEIYVISRWVTGPYFVEVPVGIDQPPDWMKNFLDFWQIVGPILMCLTFYLLLFRPWIRDREVTFEGLFCVGLFTLSFWDPISAYFQHWFQYNPYLQNRGSLVNEIPGWMSYGSPGQGIAFPYLVMPPAYVYAFTALMLLGCGFMNLLRKRWPRINNVTLVASCVVFTMLCDLVMEGFGFILLGVWTYPGAPFTLFGENTRWRYPISEMVLTGILFASLACMRFFKNDKGQTFFERGLDRVRGTPRKRLVIRAFALIAAAQVTMLVTYHLPMSIAVLQSPAWPREVQDISWLNGGLCGKGTDRACPGPGVPIARPGSPHLAPDGQFVWPNEN